MNEISLDTIKGDADANTNITFAGSDVTTFTQGGQERLRLNTTGAQVTGNIVVSGTVDGRDVAADGVTADAALSRAGGAMGGAITTNSTFDGRDVSVDGTKLDGIESGATADQTDVEIRAAVESASDSNVFTNADHSKLDAIEALADVTDATNVTAAGALMDSEVTNLAQVKAFDSSDYATAAQGTTANAALPKAGGTMTGNINITKEDPALVLTDSSSSRTLMVFNDNNNSVVRASGPLLLQVGSQSAITIDAGNATFAGTISSGAITSSGKIIAPKLSIQNQINTTSSNLEINYENGDGTTTSFKDFYVRDGKNAVVLNIQGSSKSATFSGTISSGAITTSGNVSVGGSAYTTATDLNLLGDGISIKNDKAGSNNNWSLIQNTDTGSASNLSFTTGLGVALTLNHNKSATFGGPITGTTATAAGGTNTTALASTAFVQQEITTLIGGAPANLDTLNELAAAINDEASYAAGITNLLTLTINGNGSGVAIAGTLTVGNSSIGSNSSHLANITINNNGYIGTAYDSTSLNFTTAGDLVATGKVGIGTPVNTAPGSPLTVSNLDNGTSFSSNRVLQLIGTSTTDGSRVSLAFSGNTNIGNGLAIIEAVNDDQSAGHTSLHMHTYNGSWNTENLVLKGGNVGIGTSSPGDKLTIEGSGAQVLSIYSTDTGSQSTAKTFINLYGENTGGDKRLQGQIASAPGHNASNAGELHFSTNNSSSALARRMTIREDGNVGIGTTAPDKKLHVTDSNLSSYWR